MRARFGVEMNSGRELLLQRTMLAASRFGTRLSHHALYAFPAAVVAELHVSSRNRAISTLVHVILSPECSYGRPVTCALA